MRRGPTCERAKRLLYSTNVYGLAGIIAYDRKDLDVARTNLEKALEISSAQLRRRLVSRPHPRRRGALACVRRSLREGRTSAIAPTRTSRETTSPAPRRSSQPNETRAEQIATARATIDESLRQEALSAYNAAFGFVRAQEVDRARPLLELARQHQDLKARADELLAYVNRQ